MITHCRLPHHFLVFLLMAGLSCISTALFAKPVVLPLKDTVPANKNTSKENPYAGLRNLALNVTEKDLGLTISPDQTMVYGLIMDMRVKEGTITLTAFSTGDASMYFSTGGGIIGGVAHDNVRKAALALVKKSGNDISKAMKTDSTGLPGDNEVRFFFLTNHGKFIAKEKTNNFDNSSSPWLGLFGEANNLMAAIIATTDKR